LYRSRGAMYLFNGDYDHAIADCDEAIRRNLRDSATYNNRGFATLKKGNIEKAISDLNEAIRLDPKACISYVNLGKACCIQRNYDGAIAALDEAIRIDPRNPEIASAQKRSLFGQGRMGKGIGGRKRSDSSRPKFLGRLQTTGVHLRSRK
jgi:tetratricopeptide (TPR) repeat protein